MKCAVCRKKSSVKLEYMPALCKECFCKIIEKRIRKHVRINKIFSKNDRIYVKGPLCRYLVKSIIKDLPVKYTNKNPNKIVLPYTADDACVDFLKSVFSNKSIKTKGRRDIKLAKANLWLSKGEIKQTQKQTHQIGAGLWDTNKTHQKKVKLLLPITDEEASLFAKFKHLNFKPSKKDKEIQTLLNRIQERYPETKFSLVKSYEKINNL